MCLLRLPFTGCKNLHLPFGWHSYTQVYLRSWRTCLPVDCWLKVVHWQIEFDEFKKTRFTDFTALYRNSYLAFQSSHTTHQQPPAPTAPSSNPPGPAHLEPESTSLGNWQGFQMMSKNENSILGVREPLLGISTRTSQARCWARCPRSR